MLANIKKISWRKIKAKVRSKIVKVFRDTVFYPFLYRSYWHYLFCKKDYTDNGSQIPTLYYTARPNPGAGIGHQMSNWIAGFWYAKEFGLHYVHSPFSSEKWENFLGLGVGEIMIEDLKQKNFIIRKLPLFKYNTPEEKELNRRIISSYTGKKVVFCAEQDQFLRDLQLVRFTLQQKFYNAPSRKKDYLKYDSDVINIAIHVRRGDIMTDPSNPNLTKRFLSNDYFEKVLGQVLLFVKGQQDIQRAKKDVHIYFFSQGAKEDFPEFKKFKNIHWCFDMSAIDTFLHMVYADVLITSKSSFSYKPALLNKSIKVCPQDFWHAYPTDDPTWVLVDNFGTITTQHFPPIR